MINIKWNIKNDLIKLCLTEVEMTTVKTWVISATGARELKFF